MTENKTHTEATEAEGVRCGDLVRRFEPHESLVYVSTEAVWLATRNPSGDPYQYESLKLNNLFVTA